MDKGQKWPVFAMAIFFCFLVIAQTGRQNRTAPADSASQPSDLLRPRYGENPHFPQDYVIGALGRCDASEESYRYARLIVSGLATGNGKTQGVAFPEQKRLSVLNNLSGLGTRSWRIGGGRVEPDGSVSYLIRFLGRENSITGELYLRKDEVKPAAETIQTTEAEAGSETANNETTDGGAAAGNETVFWLVDDILLENPRNLSEGKYSPGGADMAAYERFF